MELTGSQNNSRYGHVQKIQTRLVWWQRSRLILTMYPVWIFLESLAVLMEVFWTYFSLWRWFNISWLI